jgi:hypothetical protein
LSGVRKSGDKKAPKSLDEVEDMVQQQRLAKSVMGEISVGAYCTDHDMHFLKVAAGLALCRSCSCAFGQRSGRSGCSALATWRLLLLRTTCAHLRERKRLSCVCACVRVCGAGVPCLEGAGELPQPTHDKHSLESFDPSEPEAITSPRSVDIICRFGYLSASCMILALFTILAFPLSPRSSIN